MQDVEDQEQALGFSAEDFEAYSPEKWNSNMFTLQRRKVKNKLEELGVRLRDMLESSGLSLVMHLSDEFPSLWNNKQVDRQWLFFSRDEAARAELTDIIDHEKTLADSLADPTPLFRHLFLGVAVSELQVDIGLRLHFDAWVDRKNLLSLSADAERRQGLIQAIAGLPEHYELGIGEEERLSPRQFDDAALARLAEAFHSREQGLFIGACLPKDQALVIGAELADTACDIFGGLIPVYRAVAWSPANDAISLDNLVAERHEALRRSREEYERERAERERAHKEKEAIGLALKQEIAEKVQQADLWRSREIAARRAHAVKAQAASRAEDARAQAEALAAKWGLGGASDQDTIQKDEIASAKTEQEPASRPAPRIGSPRPARPRFDRSRPHPSPSGKQMRPGEYKPAEHAAARSLESATDGEGGAVSLGDRVVVTRGFLKGRRGTVQEIDEKGGIKVAFGGLSSRLELREVKGLGRGGSDRERGERGGRDSRKGFKKQNRGTLPEE